MYADLLARLEAAILRRNPGVASAFQPGVPPDDIRAQLKRAGVKGHVDPIVELYAWHNGTLFPKENDPYRLGFAPPTVETVHHDQKTIEFMEGLGYKFERSRIVHGVFNFFGFNGLLNDLRISKKFRSDPQYGILHARVLPFLMYTKTAQHLALDADPSGSGRLLSIQPTNMKGERRVREAYASFEEFLLDAIRANESNEHLTWPKAPGNPIELPVPELPAPKSTAKSKKPAIPATENVLALRTDFSDGAAWDALCAAVAEMDGESGAPLEFVSDPVFSRLAPKELPKRLAETYQHPIAVLIDQMTLSHADRPLLVVDLQDKPGRSFRATPAAFADVYDNLSTANMEFSEFAKAVDADGIFREFKS